MAITNDTSAQYFIGVMTGTSLDAIDVAIVRMTNHITLGNLAQDIQLAHFYSKTLDASLVEAMLELQTRSHDELHRAALVANALADAISRTILEAISNHGLRSRDIVAAGVHGQTIRHQPQLGYTIQLNAPARIAEATGITVISDFRSRDIAAGGQGAPLVPGFHRAIFHHDASIRAVVNIGGIANITVLQEPLTGYDTGPGNMLINHWAQQHLGQRFDTNGTWAASGQVHDDLLAAMLSDPFFNTAPPKSTGRDLFSAQWLGHFLSRPQWATLPNQDVQATLTQLTAASIAKEISRSLTATTPMQTNKEKILICGGGVHNTELMRRLRLELSRLTADRFEVASTDVAGWSPQVIEASAFAWLASRTLAGLSGNCPSVTGALGERLLGSITPA